MSLGESGLFALDELEGFLERAHFRRVPYSQVVLSTVLVFAMAASRRSVQIGRKLREVRPMRTMSAHGRRYKSGLDLMEAADVLAVAGGSHILKSLVDVIDSTTVLRAEARWEVKGIFISTFSAVIRQAMSVRPLRAITSSKSSRSSFPRAWKWWRRVTLLCLLLTKVRVERSWF